MEKVVKKLREYKNEINLKETFNFSFNFSNNFFQRAEIEKLTSLSNLYEQNIELKWLLKEKLSSPEQTDLEFWIINDWGRIKGFKRTDENIEKIHKFKQQLPKRKLSSNTFNTISSLSKIASFQDPDNYVIYDSRVIYALNWLILTCENRDGFKQKYFPMPIGRNRIIADFDMNTIINISHIDVYPN